MQLIDSQALVFGKCPEINSELDDGQQIERLFELYGMRICKHAVCATNLVSQGI